MTRQSSIKGLAGMVWVLAALLLCLGLPTSAQSPVTSGPAVSASAADMAAPTAAPATDAALGAIRSEYDALLLLAYLSVAAAVSVGLGLYLRLRRRYIEFATLKGAACATLGALLLFWAASALVLSTDSKACGMAMLETGARLDDYDAVCQAAREHAANAFGLVSAVRLTVATAGVPIAAGLVKSLALMSVPTAALLLFLLLQPLVRRLGVRA